MANAKDATLTKTQRILLVGPSGAGKTTQIWTLPGKKFLYAFDPNAVQSLRGCDVDYEAFTPDVGDLNLAIKTLRKDKGKVVGDTSSSRRALEPKTYIAWEADFEDKLDSGFFNDYNWVIFDSITTFSDMVMDRILWYEGRLGKHPEQPDWTAQMATIQNVFRVFVNLPLNVMAMGHVEIRKDDTTNRTYGHIMVTGRLRARLPLLFTNIWACYCDSDAEAIDYGIQTRLDRNNPVIRTTIKGLDMYENVTIPLGKDNSYLNPEEHGIGRILRDAT